MRLGRWAAVVMTPSIVRETPARRRSLASQGLVVALDQLGSPAFVTDARGRPVYANALGAEMLERDPAGVRERLRSRLVPPRADVREIRGPGLRPHWLVVLAAPPQRPVDPVAAATRAWKLTARQSEVLRLAVRGDANKSIAFVLACAEVTVEFHMSAIFRKAGVESRAQLVSRVWERSA